MVKSFVNGDLIPAIILWRGEGYNFVIDGSHRLSALIAWVEDDYGDGNISSSFFGHNISPEQIKKARETKKLIDSEIGSYKDILYAAQNPQIASPYRVEIAKRLSALPIQLQWVPGDASQAEKSFFKINEAASPIDSTEKRLLKARNKPNAIAARAIIRSGSGHKYWSKFSELNQNKIVEIAKEISDWLFTPQLEMPIKTLDIPLAGKNYSAQTIELILNIVNFSNNIKIVDASKIKKAENFPENLIQDETDDGEETIKYLSNTKKVLANLTGKLSSSLGLHPAIYCYSLQGRYQVTSFMAILFLINDYEKRKQLKKFTTKRKQFEEFLWKYKTMVNQATTKWGSGVKGYVNLSKLFDYIISELIKETEDDKILILLDKHEDYNFLKLSVKDLDPKYRKDFSSESKSEVFMKEGVDKALRCHICGGFLHKNSIQIDHKDAKIDGGIGNADNGQLTHPYCNSIRNDLVADGFYKP